MSGITSVKKKRPNLKNYILDEEDANSISSSARRKEIEMIRERINNGEAKMKNINQTKYQKINKPFKKMSEEEKKLHVKYLWSRVRHGVLQRNTMSFI